MTAIIHDSSFKTPSTSPEHAAFYDLYLGVCHQIGSYALTDGWDSEQFTGYTFLDFVAVSQDLNFAKHRILAILSGKEHPIIDKIRNPVKGLIKK